MSNLRLLIWVDISKVIISPFHYCLSGFGAIGVWHLFLLFPIYPRKPLSLSFPEIEGLRVSLDDVLDLSLQLNLLSCRHR